MLESEEGRAVFAAYEKETKRKVGDLLLKNFSGITMLTSLFAHGSFFNKSTG
jgi:hypothetical protein